MIHLVYLEKRNALWSLCGKTLVKDSKHWTTQITAVTCPKCSVSYKEIISR